MLTEAIRDAQTEQAVYFLLTAYIETLGYSDTYGISEKVKRLPIGSKTDVRNRLGVMRNALHAPAATEPAVRRILEEATDVFGTAFRHLRKLYAQSRLPDKPPAHPRNVKSGPGDIRSLAQEPPHAA